MQGQKSASPLHVHNRARTPPPPAPAPAINPYEHFLHAFISNDHFRQDVAISVISGAWDRLEPEHGVPLSSDPLTQYQRRVMVLIFLRGVKHAVQHAESRGLHSVSLKTEYDQYRPVFGTIEHYQSIVILHAFFRRLNHDSTDLHYASVESHPGHDPQQQLQKMCDSMSQGIEHPSDVADFIKQIPLEAFIFSQGQVPLHLQSSLREHLISNTDRRSTLPILSLIHI